MKDKDTPARKKCTGAAGARKATQAVSAQIAARFQAVFENSRDAIGVSKAGIHVFVNPAYLELFGLPPGADLAGKPVLDLIAQGSRDQIQAHILLRARGEPAPPTYETRGLRADGSEFDMEVNVSQYLENRADHTLVILRDITRRRQIEQALKSSEERLTTILDNVGANIFIKDVGYRYRYVNREVCEFFRRRAEEILGRSDNEFFSGESLEDILRSDRPVIERGETVAREETLRSSPDEGPRTYWTVKLPLRDGAGAITGLCGISTDITGLKRAEDELRMSEDRYRRLYNETPILLHSIGRDGVLVEVNDHWLKTMGFERGEVIGRKVVDFYTAASRTYAQQIVQPAFFRDGVANEVAYQFVRKDGGILDVLLSATAERDAAGAIVRSQAVIVDVTERKRTEDLLRQSEARYRSLYQGTPVMMHSIDATGRLVSVSDRWLEQLGYTRDEVLGRPSTDFLDEQSRTYARTVVLPDFMRTGVCADVPYTFVQKNGESISTLLSAIAERDEDGKVVRSLAVIIDVTEKKRAEAALRESEERFRCLVEQSPVAISIVDAYGRVEYVNEKHVSIVGYTAGEIPTLELWWRKTSPDEATRQRIKAAWVGIARRISGGEEVDPVERTVVCKDGSSKNVELRFTRLGDKILTVFIDITERKRVEAALRESEARLDLALQSAHMGVWRWEIAENRRHFDELTCRMLGIDAATFSGSDAEFLQAVHPDDRELVKAALARSVAQDVPYAPTYRVVWPDGSVHYLAARGRLIRDGKGQPVRVNGILWDITDQRLLEQERIKMQKLESVGTLAGGIAHDFNNLLQGVFGFISMARLTHDQKEKSLAMLEQAERALQQSVNLTSQLLTFSKGGRPVKKVVGLRSLIENAVALALSGSRNTAEIDIEPDLRPVEADRGQIGQVIQNIVLNADQAMPLGGVIRVVARNVPAAALVPPAELQGELVEIEINDQGAGIPPEHLTRIFDPYFTTKEKGSGLGLASSFSIVGNHGGLLRVQSHVGRGTTFRIYLPAAAAQSEQPYRPEIPAASRTGRILVMDDEEMIRELAGEMLLSLGHEVVAAANGETALEAYRSARQAGRPFDVVILDLTIRGGMGGVETVRKLAQIDPDVKAVVSSGYSEDAARSNYREQGFRAVLNKPYSVAELQSVMNSLLM